MSFYVPPGYWLLREQEDRGDDKALRDLLACGAYQAFYVNPGGALTPILPMEWSSDQGEAMIEFACHHHFLKDDKGRWVSPIKDNPWFADEYRQRLIVVAEVEDEGEDDEKSDAAKVDAQSPSRKPGGRPQKYDWEAILVEIGRFAHDHGRPETQEALIRHVLTWYSANHDGVEPSRSDVQKRVTRFWRALKW